MSKCKKSRKYTGGGDVDNTAGYIGAAAYGIGTVGNYINTVNNYGDYLEDKTQSPENYIDSIANTSFYGAGKDTLSKMSSAYSIKDKDYTTDDFGGETDVAGSILSGAGSGLAAGAATGNPLISIGTTIVGGLFGGLTAEHKNSELRDRVEFLNKKKKQAEKIRENNLNSAIASNDAITDRWRLQNMLNNQYSANAGIGAFGGLLETNGSTWKTGASFIENGGSHENNPNGGVQFGVASDGLPNLVEEGEVVIKVPSSPNGQHSFAEGGTPDYNDFVLSKRRYPILEEIENANITTNPERYVGMPWADIYKDILDRNHIKEIINRQDTKDYIDSLNNRTARAHEATAFREDSEKLMKKLKKATPEEQDMILQQMGYLNPLEEAMVAAKGGKIHIKPENRGKFTETKRRTGKTTEELTHSKNPLTRKRAIFAQNARKWNHKHAEGGYLFPWGGWKDQDELNKYYAQQYTDFYSSLGKNARSRKLNSNYLTGAQARQWVSQLEAGDEQQKALAAMLKNQWGDNLDWSNNATWEFKNRYNPKGIVTESAPYIKWAGDNAAMKDALWGIQHVPQLSVDNRYLTPTYIQINDDGTFTTLDAPGFEERIVAGKTPQYPKGFTPEAGKNYKFYYPETVEADILNRESNNSEEQTYLGDLNEEETSGGLNSDILLPLTSLGSVTSDLLGITNRPDYTNANFLEKNMIHPTYVGYDPSGRYVQPVITDTRYTTSKALNQGNRAVSAAKDLSGSNRSTALANMLTNNYLTQLAIGENTAKENITNNKALQEAIAANNLIDKINSEGYLKADMANQSAKLAADKENAEMRGKAALLREKIDEAVAANRSANWNNFLENLQAYFDNQRNLNMANNAYASTHYSEDNSGNIRYRNRRNKKKK